MLPLLIQGVDGWDEDKNEFIKIPSQKLQLEHSLYSISKWEQKWKIPFLDSDVKTIEQSIDYVKMMTLNFDEINENIYSFISPGNWAEINNYMKDPMTATVFKNTKKTSKRSSEKTTAETIYFWMIECGIPFECQYWNFNRLIALIEMCSIKNQPQKKMSRREILEQNSRINAMRRKAAHSKG